MEKSARFQVYAKDGAYTTTISQSKVESKTAKWDSQGLKYKRLPDLHVENTAPRKRGRPSKVTVTSSDETLLEVRDFSSQGMIVTNDIVDDLPVIDKIIKPSAIGFEQAKETVIDALEREYQDLYKKAIEKYRAIQMVKQLLF